MSLPFIMRFDFRNPASAGTSAADRYAAPLMHELDSER